MDRYMVLVVVQLLLLTQVVAQQDTLSTSLSEELEQVEIFATRPLEDHGYVLSRKQFLTAPGALEDPTRLLINYPGVAPTNDQANHITYQGLPPHFHDWTLYGARILNPNHQSNAGTNADFPSRTGGGVNMISAQSIGSLSFRSHPDAQALLSAGAVSDLTLRRPIDNRISTNLSLVGLEIGADRYDAHRDRGLAANVRYGTVGLLTDVMGLDFDNEVITYQDATCSFHQGWSGDRGLEVYGIYGDSENNKSALANADATVYKDYREILFDARMGLIGAHYASPRLDATINFSTRSTRRTDHQKLDTPVAIERDDLYTAEERLLAANIIFRPRPDSRWSPYLSLLPEWSSSDIRFVPSPLSSRVVLGDADFLRTIVTGGFRIDDHAWQVHGAAGLSHETMGGSVVPLWSAHIARDLDIGVIVLSTARSSQPYAPEWVSSVDMQQILADHVAVSWRSEHYRLSAWHHRLYHLFTIDGISGSTFDLSEYLPTVPYLDEANGLTTDGSATSSGLSASAFATTYGWEVAANATIMTSDQDDTEVPLPGDLGHMINLTASRTWSYSHARSFGFAFSAHYYGGRSALAVDQEASLAANRTLRSASTVVVLDDFFRVDARFILSRGARSMLSLDIQNLLGTRNGAFDFYDPITMNVERQLQLGTIPVLSWRRMW